MNASSLRIIPFVFNSAAMRRVEYPGRSITKICPEGETGASSAHANQPAPPSAAIRMSQTTLRRMTVEKMIERLENLRFEAGNGLATRFQSSPIRFQRDSSCTLICRAILKYSGDHRFLHET